MAPTVKRTYRFAIIPEWVLDHPELDGVAIRVFGILDRYAGEHSEAWPGLNTVAARSQLSVDTVRRAVSRLAGVGAVRVTRRYDSEGRQTSNSYLLAGDGPLNAPAPNAPSTDATPDPSEDATHPPSTGATRKRAMKNENQMKESEGRFSSGSGFIADYEPTTQERFTAKPPSDIRDRIRKQKQDA